MGWLLDKEGFSMMTDLGLNIYPPHTYTQKKGKRKTTKIISDHDQNSPGACSLQNVILINGYLSLENFRNSSTFEALDQNINNFPYCAF